MIDDSNDPIASLAAALAMTFESRKELESQLKETTQKELSLSLQLAELMAANDVQSLRTKKHTVFLREQIFVNKSPGATKQEVCDALTTWGWATPENGLVHDDYTPATVKAVVVATIKDGEELPDDFETVFKTTTQTRAMVRSA